MALTHAQKEALDWLKDEGKVARAGARWRSLQILWDTGRIEHVYDVHHGISSTPKWVLTVAPIVGDSYVRLKV